MLPRILTVACLFAAAAWSLEDWGSVPPPPAASPIPASDSGAPPPDSAALPRAAAPASTPRQAPAPWERVPLPSAIARQVQLLKLRANGMYRARKYREACDLYAAVADLDTSDAAARNDLGLCHRALGNKDTALAAARAALRIADRSLAAPDTSAWSYPDLRARKTAYFTLDKLGGSMTEPKPGQCETWSAGGACPARLHVCAEQGHRPQGGGTLRWGILRAGLTRAHALFGYDEVEVPSQVPRLEMRDMEELGIDGTPESKIRWLNRDSSVTLPNGEFLETADPDCFPDCHIAGNLEKERVRCRVIHFDPCAGVIGMACAFEEEGKDRILIGEYYLAPAAPR